MNFQFSLARSERPILHSNRYTARTFNSLLRDQVASLLRELSWGLMRFQFSLARSVDLGFVKLTLDGLTFNSLLRDQCTCFV